MSILKAVIRIDMPVSALAGADLEWPAGGEAVQPPTISLFEGDDPAKSLIEIFAAKPVDEAELAIFIETLGNIVGHDIPAPIFESVADKDWVSESQRLRQPVNAGRFTICEAHQRESISAAREVIVIEAGQAFGTGGHGSTLGCLMALDALAEAIDAKNAPNNAPRSALDLGTGSGVLAIAMARLWNIPILASDIDPVATMTAADNVAENVEANSRSEIEIVTADGVGDPAIAVRAPFDLITANILAKPLIGLAPGIAGISAPEGTLVIAGVTRDQAAEVATAYGEAGFAEASRIALDEWCTLVFVRKA